MKFFVDPDKVTTGELLDAEGNIRAMNNLMARFVVDNEGNPIPQDEALKQLLALSFSANYRAQDDFLASLFRENARNRH